MIIISFVNILNLMKVISPTTNSALQYQTKLSYPSGVNRIEIILHK